MFIIFGGERYYASGGGNDFLGGGISLEAVITIAEGLMGKRAITEIDDWSEDRDCHVGHDIEWAHIFDMDELKIVWESETKPYGCGITVEIRESEDE